MLTERFLTVPNLIKKALFRVILIAALSSTSLGSVFAQSAVSDNASSQENIVKNSADKQPTIRKVGVARTFTLENGLQVVVIEDHRAPVVTQMVWYHAGSADEPMGRTGIAHFLEHLMFKGTKQHQDGEFSKFVSKIGGEENAFTSYDYTGYYQSVAPQYLKKIMEFESDRMENLVLTDAVIAPERNVIIEERRMRTDNSPEAMLAEETQATLFMNSPYHNPVIGWKQEMEKLTRDDAIAFYNKFYTPSNATLIISGDVSAEKVLELTLETYGKLANRANPGPRIRPQEPVKNTSRTVTMRDPRVSEPSYQEMWTVPSYKNAKNKQDAFALDLLGEILGGSSRSRLYQSLIVEKGSAAAVGSGYSGNAVDDGTFYVYGMPRGSASLDDVRDEVQKQLNDIRKNGVSQSELDQARKRFVKNMIFSLDNPTGLAKIYGSTLAIGLSVEDVTNWSEKLKDVKTQDIKMVAERYLDSHKSVTSYLLPPQKPNLAQPQQQTGTSKPVQLEVK